MIASGRSIDCETLLTAVPLEGWKPCDPPERWPLRRDKGAMSSVALAGMNGAVRLETADQILEAVRLELITKSGARQLLGLDELDQLGRSKETLLPSPASAPEIEFKFSNAPPFPSQLMAEFIRGVPSKRRRVWSEGLDLAASWLIGRSWVVPRTVGELELELNRVLGCWDAQLSAADDQAQLNHGIYKIALEAAGAFAEWANAPAPDGRGARWQYFAEHWLRETYPAASSEALELVRRSTLDPTISDQTCPSWFAKWTELHLEDVAPSDQDERRRILLRLGELVADLYSPEQLPDVPGRWEALAADHAQDLGPDAFQRQVDVAGDLLDWLNADVAGGVPRWARLADEWLANRPPAAMPERLPDPVGARERIPLAEVPAWFTYVAGEWANAQHGRQVNRGLTWMGSVLARRGFSEPAVLAEVLAAWDNDFALNCSRQSHKTQDTLRWVVPSMARWGAATSASHGRTQWDLAIDNWGARL